MDRYSRQLRIFGKAGQEKISKSTVTVVGAGGLGSSTLLYLAAAGVGAIRVVDYECVELSNLNRQVLYGESDIGEKKSAIAAKRMRALNSEIDIKPIDARIDEKNAHDIIEDSDVVVDCLDNWETRFVINRACVEESIPLVHGAAEGMCGQLMVVRPGGACLACIFSEKLSAEKKEFDVIGFAPGVVGCMEGMEAIKIITEKESLRDELLLIDLETDEFQKIKITKKEECEVCG
jgi:molybdopterin/thiamine biosynthesis adenylyltransferase